MSKRNFYNDLNDGEILKVWHDGQRRWVTGQVSEINDDYKGKNFDVRSFKVSSKRAAYYFYAYPNGGYNVAMRAR